MAKDKITLDRIQLMHPDVREEVSRIYDLISSALTGKAICRFAYTLRTYKEQDALYAIGRTVNPTAAKVTNARGGQSYHNFGLAFDIVLLKDTNGDGTFDSASWETNVDFDKDGIPDWKEVVNIAKQHGWEWGGDWKFTDMPHFQKTLGFSVVQLDTKMKSGKVIDKGPYPQLK